VVLHSAEPHYLLPACIGAAAFANLSVVMAPTPRSVAPTWRRNLVERRMGILTTVFEAASINT